MSGPDCENIECHGQGSGLDSVGCVALEDLWVKKWHHQTCILETHLETGQLRSYYNSLGSR